jgi:hypothetical protein
VTAVPDVPARLELEAALRLLLPGGWRIVADERVLDDSDATTLRLSQRTVERLSIAGTGVHDVGFTATITTAGTDLVRAEARLDDELEAFLWALDSAGILWESATKGLYGEANAQRLGYQLSIHVSTARTPDEIPTDSETNSDEESEIS